ncbi:FecR family protein [Janthinobacterium agaricidamnosum]|uniref:FecR family protein n=1 Tax=Janthinobacterium agaricidamnosum TaxID=55508 RepID=UPI00057099BF|nr:FecR family protein [Janthinobacterium agaricidamnosum]
MTPRKCIAAKVLLWLALSLMGGAAWAGQVVGTVINLSGPLMAKKADGKVKILAVKSEVEQGDVLVTEKNTYALVKFIDNGEITLKPDSAFVIDQFTFEADQPDNDRASFNLIKGGLRSVTGLLGKRNKEKFLLKTPLATIGIRGTNFTAQYVPLIPLGTPGPGLDGLAPGLYVQVLDGMIHVQNNGGQQSFSAGQFGFIPSGLMAPIIVPPNPNPNIQFTPPPAFSSSSGTTSPSAQGNGKPGDVDCIVR